MRLDRGLPDEASFEQVTDLTARGGAAPSPLAEGATSYRGGEPADDDVQVRPLPALVLLAARGGLVVERYDGTRVLLDPTDLRLLDALSAPCGTGELARAAAEAGGRPVDEMRRRVHRLLAGGQIVQAA